MNRFFSNGDLNSNDALGTLPETLSIPSSPTNPAYPLPFFCLKISMYFSNDSTPLNSYIISSTSGFGFPLVIVLSKIVIEV